MDPRKLSRLVPPVMRRGHTSEHTNIKENLKDGVNYVKKEYNLKDPLFMKDAQEGKNINNLWSGYKLGGKGKAITTASLLGGGTLIAANPRGYQGLATNGGAIGGQSEQLDVESLQSTRGDASGYQAQVGANSSLTTSGDLVFAMHKTRHSGQL